jgi:hypothetical protein
MCPVIYELQSIINIRPCGPWVLAYLAYVLVLLRIDKVVYLNGHSGPWVLSYRAYLLVLLRIRRVGDLPCIVALGCLHTWRMYLCSCDPNTYPRLNRVALGHLHTWRMYLCSRGSTRLHNLMTSHTCVNKSSPYYKLTAIPCRIHRISSITSYVGPSAQELAQRSYAQLITR